MEPAEAFDWHHADLIKNPPYNQADMIHQLVDGRFIIEGKQSGIEDAQLFADMLVEEKKDTPELWDALDHHTPTPDKLLAGNISNMKDLMNQINKDTEDLKEMLEYKRYTITLRDKEGNEIVETVDAKNIMHATQRAIEGHEDYFPVSYKEHES